MSDYVAMVLATLALAVGEQLLPLRFVFCRLLIRKVTYRIGTLLAAFFALLACALILHE